MSNPTTTQVQILLSALEACCAPEPDGFGSFVGDEFMPEAILNGRKIIAEYRQSQTECEFVKDGLPERCPKHNHSPSSELIALTPLEHYLAVKQSGLEPKPLITASEIEAAAMEFAEDNSLIDDLRTEIKFHFTAGATFILEKLGVGLK